MNNTKRPEKEFGSAKDYYRVRLLRMEEQLPDDLEWRDDVLFASPKEYPGKLNITYRLHVQTYKNQVYELANLKDQDDAKKRYKKMRKDLSSMTKREFDKKYKLEEFIDRGQSNGDGQVSILQEPIARGSMIFMGVRRAEHDGEK